ncbi:MAG: ATP synthase subunit I [Granulosicoccaceae bacterium]|jgi:F0F1-type ATP synthase assembly protein I
MRKQLIWIAIVIAAAATAAYYGYGIPAALAILGGGGITLINLGLTRWHMRRAEKQARADAAQNLRILYACALQRFIATVSLLAIAIGIWKLPPLGVIGGFILALLAQYLADTNFKT